ncbi:glycosyltransferase family 31 protein [Aspergillus nidulans FGSC A4]|uniref:N-acetylgalactosaminide beta-1,3-galactosyltransferase n=1 Tax=Emericella nidulans (strain FGSC A4 / ATCC 38163 / CBS 112.46 / NRRL 194 / M139) TaxID=227321 RepID=C8VAA0_EMENI|nr:hypothetical protein [Aspergillus nidulans FGSC A4]CBF76694.1 TPA: conserved hypothetical protein [Aspergillus nidulans FGSC A4]
MSSVKLGRFTYRLVPQQFRCRMGSHRGIRRRVAVVATLLTLFLIYHFTIGSVPYQPSSSQYTNSARTSSDKKQSQCLPLPGIEDVLVVMKTGVTEALDKVPVHFKTTLRCIPNYVIYSDFEEKIDGVQIHDAFRNIDPAVKQNVDDFQIYNRLSKRGREGLQTQDFADEANSAIGKPNNPGWKLDKWKFLPMVKEAHQYKPDAKWFVFMEADTYYSWPTLLAWLSHFDPSEPHYIGTETQIADVIFAHGGSGFVLSNPAMKLAADEYTERADELHEYTDAHWAGDCVLGKVLSNVGVNLSFSWPILQNSNIGELDEFTTTFYRRPWCFPAVALHHLSPDDIRFLHDFEHRRLAKSSRLPLLHSDIFKELIFPELSNVRNGWDNLSDKEQPTLSTFQECQSYCKETANCVQFVMRDGTCYTGETPRLGSHNSNAQSGWIINKIENMVDQAPQCVRPDFGL